jgi:hypothetical protein
VVVLIPDALALTQRQEQISMCDIVRCRTRAGAIFSITRRPRRRDLSAFELPQL